MRNVVAATTDGDEPTEEQNRCAGSVQWTNTTGLETRPKRVGGIRQSSTGFTGVRLGVCLEWVPGSEVYCTTNLCTDSMMTVNNVGIQ